MKLFKTRVILKANKTQHIVKVTNRNDEQISIFIECNKRCIRSFHKIFVTRQIFTSRKG